MNSLKAACFALVIIAVIAAFAIYPSLSKSVPSHWNIAGEVDSYGPSWLIAFLFPGIMAAMLLMFVLIPKIDPLKANIKSFEKTYWAMSAILEVFFLLFFVTTMLPNYGIAFNLSQVFAVLLGLLFIAMGILMPHFKRNYFVGIRTPWAIANDEVWKKTHELGGKLFIAVGIITIISAAMPNIALLFSIALIIAAAFGTMAYSFFVYRKIGEKTKKRSR